MSVYGIFLASSLLLGDVTIQYSTLQNSLNFLAQNNVLDYANPKDATEISAKDYFHIKSIRLAPNASGSAIAFSMSARYAGLIKSNYYCRIDVSNVKGTMSVSVDGPSVVVSIDNIHIQDADISVDRCSYGTGAIADVAISLITFFNLWTPVFKFQANVATLPHFLYKPGRIIELSYSPAIKISVLENPMASPTMLQMQMEDQ